MTREFVASPASQVLPPGPRTPAWRQLIPFGGSNRICLGMPFALYEMKVVLATLFSQVRLARPEAPRPRARRYGLVLGPDEGGRIVVLA